MVGSGPNQSTVVMKQTTNRAAARIYREAASDENTVMFTRKPQASMPPNPRVRS